MVQVKADTYVYDVINYPGFAGFGEYIFPLDWYRPKKSMTLREVGDLLPYHNYVRVDETVKVVNEMLVKVNAGETIFYPVYSPEEIRRDRRKAEVGLFHFRGRAGAPFAIISAGGGFAYVGSIHESFPHALALSSMGYHGFALHYRTGSADMACEDLAAAIAFVVAHAKELGVGTDCYSLWGGSAGARMAAYLGSYGTEVFGAGKCPRAGAVIMQYTGHQDVSRSDPPTYACVGENDRIAYWPYMQRRIDKLNRLGVETEFHVYKNLVHGFGMGTGTSAAGWFDDAVAFWERQMR